MERLLMSHPEHDYCGPHLSEEHLFDLLLDLPPDAEWEEACRHLASCEACQDLLRHRGAQWERLRASRAPAAALDFAAAFQRSGSRQRGSEAAGPPSVAEQPEKRSGWEWLGEVGRSVLGALRRPRYAWGLGGVVLVAVGAWLLTVNPRNSIPFPSTAEWLPSAAESLELRDDAGEAEATALIDGLNAYDRRDLPAAIRALSAAGSSGAMESLRLVFLGSALTQAGEYRRAVQILRSAPLATLPESWRGPCYWTLLVAFHRAGNDSAADSLLHALADQAGATGVRARRLLGRPDP